MASRLAITAATTDAQPLMPQAHGTRPGAQWEIGIGQIALRGGYEGMARYATHRVEHGGVERCRHRAATAFTRDQLDRAHHVEAVGRLRVGSCGPRRDGEQE